jgi:homoserine kinase
MALAPRCTVWAEIAAEWSIEHMSAHAPGDEEPDGVLRAARAAVGERPLTLRVDTEIPIGRGLGSSSAAFVAGAAAALRAIGEEAAPDRVYRIAAELEGHGEQVGAAVYGGLVLVPAEGMPMRLPLHPTLRPVVAVPEARLATIEARAVVDAVQPLDVVIRSLSRVGALTAGLITADPGMLAAAHGDEIHEGPRARLTPGVTELIDIARSAGALHAARSGAGPAVVAIVTAETAGRVAGAFAKTGAGVIDAPVDTVGLV